MPTALTEISPRKAALIAGSSLLIMVIAVILAFPNTLSLIVPKDAAKTAQALLAAGIKFRLGIVGWIVVLVCDVLVAWALYLFFKPVDESISLLAAWFRLFYTAIFAVSLLALLLVLLLLGGADSLKVFSTPQLHATVLFILNGFNWGWMFGLFFFGVHLFFLGVLVLKSNDVPKILGLLLMLAAFGYMGDSLMKIALPNYEQYESLIKMIVGPPNAIGELALAFWLLFKGGKNQPTSPKD